MAVQLAKWRGAHVIGTASENIDLLDSPGVDHAINYTEAAFEDHVHDIDLVLDTIGGETLQRSWGTLKPGGALVSMLEQPQQEIAEEYGVNPAMLWTHPPTGETLKKVSELIGDGTIKPVVSTILPLEEIKKGHQMIETKHARGKIVLQVAF
jgi:NADPH:quinone reductase-like Zn-dependent oxidoreductase